MVNKNMPSANLLTTDSPAHTVNRADTFYVEGEPIDEAHSRTTLTVTPWRRLSKIRCVQYYTKRHKDVVVTQRTESDVLATRPVFAERGVQIFFPRPGFFQIRGKVRSMGPLAPKKKRLVGSILPRLAKIRH